MTSGGRMVSCTSGRDGRLSVQMASVARTTATQVGLEHPVANSLANEN